MSVLRALLYFSIFKYPLDKEEIYKFSNISSRKDTDRELDILIKKNIIFKFQNYYTSINDPNLVDRRLKGNEMAKKIMPKAMKIARFIAKFPYVENVSLSGSLSKGYYDQNCDIDFFIITKPNGLWIARTLLILYKKIFLLNSYKYFCVNYFISCSHLKIDEQNIFTATEMVTLMPAYGRSTFVAFMKENPWPYNYFPNIPPFDFSSIKVVSKNWLCLGFEKIFNNSIGNSIDTLLMRITLKKWYSKFGDLDAKDFKIAMKTTKSASKHHPQNFQKKVIERLNDEYDRINKKYNLQLLENYA